MKITNHHNLPESLVRAIRNDPYTRGDADISCTTLVGPPLIRYLMEQHDAEVEEDAVDRIWSLLGQAVHYILERAGGASRRRLLTIMSEALEADSLAPIADALEEEADTPGLLEERLYASTVSTRISGQLDVFEKGLLTDYKVTSVWAVLRGVKAEWEAQLNILAWLMRRNGYEPMRLQIIAILRDWRRNEMLRDRQKTYPRVQVAVLKVPLWDDRRAQAYVEERLAQHQLGKGKPRRCTAEERWDKPTQYAVMAPGRKTALKVEDTVQRAVSWQERYDSDINAKGKHRAHAGKTHIEERLGRHTRCEEYCPVSRWCEWWQTEGKGDVL